MLELQFIGEICKLSPYYFSRDMKTVYELTIAFCIIVQNEILFTLLCIHIYSFSYNDEKFFKTLSSNFLAAHYETLKRIEITNICTARLYKLQNKIYLNIKGYRKINFEINCKII
ncbi:hypothetical protein V1478_018899, partial [Vespula squamosa]